MKRDQAARSWRRAKTPADAWKHFRAFVARHGADLDDDGDVPHWSTRLQFTEAWTGPSATRLLVFQKRHVMTSFFGPGPTTRAEKLRVASVVAPFLPRKFDAQLLRAHAKLLGSPPLGFVGDLSPYGLHVFGALRSGDLDKPRLDGRALDLKWLGVDDSWLLRVAKTDRPHRDRLIAMGWIEREYWEIVKRLLPGVSDLIGAKSYALLDEGCTLGSDGFEDVLGDELTARLRRMIVKPR